jgi:hypothetical protein
VSGALTPIARASQTLADAISAIPGIRVYTTIAAPVAPPAVVVGPPRLRWSDYGTFSAGQPTTCQWSVYLTVAMHQYSLDVLLGEVAHIVEVIERHTTAVVIAAGPGVYPTPTGGLPAYIIVVQAEVSMMQ